MPRRSRPGAAIVGQAEFWVASHLLSTLGADILAVFLFLAGLILVTGATLARLIRATGAGVAGTGRALRRSTEDLAATVARRPGHARARPRGRGTDAPRPMTEPDSLPILPPEPDTAELVSAPPTSRRRRSRPRRGSDDAADADELDEPDAG